MLPPSVPTADADAPPPARLHVRAGGAVLALSMDLLVASGASGRLTPVPGAPAWLAGLGQVDGRLITVVDAGRLFAQSASTCRWLLTLKGVPCEVALGVDELLGVPGADGEADLRLDAATLGRHPAFQPGAAGRRAGEA
jgi:hypothetical protein